MLFRATVIAGKGASIMTGKTTQPAPASLLAGIAKAHLFIETLETRHSDRLDFHNVAVWGVQDALEAAFMAGQAAAKRTPRKEPRS
jgi:hypothetical protein